MPIIVTLEEMLHQRRVSLTELSEQVEITLANLSILKTGKARAIRFSTLDGICRALQCQPGDILRWVPATDSDADIADDDPIGIDPVPRARAG